VRREKKHSSDNQTPKNHITNQMYLEDNWEFKRSEEIKKVQFESMMKEDSKPREEKKVYVYSSDEEYIKKY
jgi:hypothetical protein